MKKIITDVLRKNHFKTVYLKKTIIGIVVLFCGFIGMAAMSQMKTPPAEATIAEPVIKAEVKNVMPEDVQVYVKGYGELIPLEIVDIAPEVSGKIIYIHPALEPGEIIDEGEVLFKIDPRDYFLDVTYNEKRLKSLERRRDLAKMEFERIRKLHRKDMVESRSRVDDAEQVLNGAQEIVDRTALALEKARIRLERCEVSAPFKARVISSQLEKGQSVAPLVNVITLANDAVLEAHVPIDSREVKTWLRFDQNVSQVKDQAWFNSVVRVPCDIQWTEAEDGHAGKGELHRVVNFDKKMRTITLAARINGENARLDCPEELPLVAGMFCSIIIPGKKLKNIVRLPRQAVTAENTVFVVKNGRLKTVTVQVARVENDEAYIFSGLHSGDQVIVTRLIDPLENSKVEIIKTIETV